MAKLTPRQALFVAEYLKDLNATQAALRAGYSESTARAQGSRLLVNADIQAAIDAGKAKRAKRVEVTQDRVVREIAAIAFSNIADVLDVDGQGEVSVRQLSQLTQRQQRAIESITQVKSEKLSADSGVLETVRLTVKMHSKTTALRMLMDHIGMDAPKRMEHTGKDGEPIEFKGVSFRELVEMAKLGGDQ